jgi:hypothetical protein
VDRSGEVSEDGGVARAFGRIRPVSGRGPCSRACQCKLTAHGRSPQGDKGRRAPAPHAVPVHAPTAEPAQHAQNQCDDGPGRSPLFWGWLFLSAENKRFVVFTSSELILVSLSICHCCHAAWHVRVPR